MKLPLWPLAFRLGYLLTLIVVVIVSVTGQEEEAEWSNELIIEPSCLTPLTVVFAARQEWYGEFGEFFLYGASQWNQLLDPATPKDQIINLTYYVDPMSTGLLAFGVGSYGIPGFGLIASVSYDGKRIPEYSTGTAASMWRSNPEELMTDDDYYYWTDVDHDDSHWSFADNYLQCSRETTLVSNYFGYNYVETISANGLAPGQMLAEEDKARWVGESTDCSVDTYVMYRAKIDYVWLTSSQWCNSAPPTDPRFHLSVYNPMLSSTLGFKTADTKELVIHTVVHGEFELYVGRLVTASIREYSIDYRATSDALQSFTFHVVPSAIVIAYHVRSSSDLRGFLASVVYNNRLIAYTGPRTSWKMAATSIEPAAGWNTAWSFDDSRWLSIPATASDCDDLQWPLRDYLAGMYGACPKVFWANGCDSVQEPVTTDIYLRLKVDLRLNPPIATCTLPPGTTTTRRTSTTLAKAMSTTVRTTSTSKRTTTTTTRRTSSTTTSRTTRSTTSTTTTTTSTRTRTSTSTTRTSTTTTSTRTSTSTSRTTTTTTTSISTTRTSTTTTSTRSSSSTTRSTTTPISSSTSTSRSSGNTTSSKTSTFRSLGTTASSSSSTSTTRSSGTTSSRDSTTRSRSSTTTTSSSTSSTRSSTTTTTQSSTLLPTSSTQNPAPGTSTISTSRLAPLASAQGSPQFSSGIFVNGSSATTFLFETLEILAPEKTLDISSEEVPIPISTVDLETETPETGTSQMNFHQNSVVIALGVVAAVMCIGTAGILVWTRRRTALRNKKTRNGPEFVAPSMMKLNQANVDNPSSPERQEVYGHKLTLPRNHPDYQKSQRDLAVQAAGGETNPVPLRGGSERGRGTTRRPPGSLNIRTPPVKTEEGERPSRPTTPTAIRNHVVVSPTRVRQHLPSLPDLARPSPNVSMGDTSPMAPLGNYPSFLRGDLQSSGTGSIRSMSRRPVESGESLSRLRDPAAAASTEYVAPSPQQGEQRGRGQSRSPTSPLARDRKAVGRGNYPPSGSMSDLEGRNEPSPNSDPSDKTEYVGKRIR